MSHAALDFIGYGGSVLFSWMAARSMGATGGRLPEQTRPRRASENIQTKIKMSDNSAAPRSFACALLTTGIRSEPGIFRIVMREGRGAVNEGFVRPTQNLISPEVLQLPVIGAEPRGTPLQMTATSFRLSGK